jgi:hypothetical protein
VRAGPAHDANESIDASAVRSMAGLSITPQA